MKLFYHNISKNSIAFLFLINYCFLSCYCSRVSWTWENRWCRLITVKPSVFFIQIFWTLCHIYLPDLQSASKQACSCIDRDDRCFRNFWMSRPAPVSAIKWQSDLSRLQHHIPHPVTFFWIFCTDSEHKWYCYRSLCLDSKLYHSFS